jgi:hypothetical protein
VVTYHGAESWVESTPVGYDTAGRRLWSGSWAIPMRPVVPEPVAVAVRMHSGQTVSVDFHLLSVSQGRQIRASACRAETVRSCRSGGSGSLEPAPTNSDARAIQGGQDSRDTLLLSTGARSVDCASSTCWTERRLDPGTSEVPDEVRSIMRPAHALAARLATTTRSAGYRVGGGDGADDCRCLHGRSGGSGTRLGGGQTPPPHSSSRPSLSARASRAGVVRAAAEPQH